MSHGDICGNDKTYVNKEDMAEEIVIVKCEEDIDPVATPGPRILSPEASDTDRL